MSHTPGPWALDINNDGSLPCGRVFANGNIIATCWKAREDDGPLFLLPSVPNARLMAAAPDLLAACKAALSFGEGHPGRTVGWDDLRLDTQVALRAAIAKAGGAA